MVTDQQVRRLMKIMKSEKTKETAADKAGMDRKTARKYLKFGKLPSEMEKSHDWRTRKDPFEGVWDNVREMLETNPGLEAKTIFEYLQREYVNRFQDGQLRTLQRHIKIWRATEGPAREIFFPQEHYPGELSESDFTYMNGLGVTIQRELFEHIIYHFVLTYSNWETGTICFSESFESLSAGYQNALWELGGASKKHRIDRMSAAVNKDCNPEKFTRRYKALMRHYKVEPERTNPTRANENGDIEQRHYRFKNAVKQALMLRGSRDFTSRKAYEEFLKNVFAQLNAGRYQRLQEELALLGKLPARRIDNYKPVEATVGPSSTVHIQHNTYSVHSRLIGEKVKIRIYVDHLEVWYAQRLIERIPRVRGTSKHHIQYRHIIDWLVRKPGAFENYRYKSDMFPSSYFRMAYDCLKKHNPLRANKEYIKILYIAAKEGENLTESAIKRLFAQEQIVSLESISHIIKQNGHLPSIRDVVIDNVSLDTYDELLTVGKEVVNYG